MCEFVEDRIKGERKIYESVRKIYDIRSSSEESLDNRKRHDKSSIKNSPKITRTASLFIDRIKNDFQREDNFVPRFRTQRNWCPKFIGKYFCETKHEEQPRFLGRSISKSLVSVTPKVYSIGLYEPKKKTKRKIELDDEVVPERVVENLKRCSFLVRRNLSGNKLETKKWMPNLLSSSVMSIPPLITIPIEFHLPLINEKSKIVRSDVTTDDSVYYSLSQRSLFDEDGKFDPNECSTERNSKKLLNSTTFISEQFIPNGETSKDENPSKELEKDFFLEDISSIDSLTSKCGEFFTPFGTTRKVESVSDDDDDDDDNDDDDCNENEILEDIRKRIDKDFEKISSSSKILEEENFDDFSYSEDSNYNSSYNKNYYFDNDNETFINSNDDFTTSIEQSKSVPIISTIDNTHYHSSKSLTLISSTLVQDDFSDQSSTRLSTSKDIVDKLQQDSKDRSITDDHSSINSTIYYDYNYDFPLTCQESNMIIDPENDQTRYAKSSFNYPNVTNVFSIPNVTLDNKIDLSSELNLSKLKKLKKLQNRSLTRQKISEHLVESIDSGVITDYSRNDLRVCGSVSIDKNTNVSYVPGKQQFFEKPSYNVSDSICSDDSLDRRVDRAVQKCTEDLIILERRAKHKLKTIGTRHRDTSRNNFFTFFDWFNGDECIGSISTPSLISLTDSETS
ncbi:hypothetical protein M0802_007151 [Mischocyttarus mexicanus]|nr:hypothetical protein M0802_007151 [Mischocyttarus mexicanus]